MKTGLNEVENKVNDTKSFLKNKFDELVRLTKKRKHNWRGYITIDPVNIKILRKEHYEKLCVNQFNHLHKVDA